MLILSLAATMSQVPEDEMAIAAGQHGKFITVSELQRGDAAGDEEEEFLVCRVTRRTA